MIAAPPGVRVYLACGTTDMRRGMVGLAMQVQQVLAHNPFDGAVFAFRGRGAGLIKLLWHDGIGLCLFDQLPVFILHLFRLVVRILVPSRSVLPLPDR